MTTSSALPRSAAVEAALPLLLKQLKLARFRSHWQPLAEQAEAHGWSPGQFLYSLCELELEQRQIARQQRLLRGAHLPWQKGLDGYSFGEDCVFDHQHLDPRPWQELQGLAQQTTWLVQAENLLLFGPSGVGKTHLAIAITMAMAAQDQACRFFPATALVQLLQKAKAAYDLPAMLQKLDRYALLVIDDISYVRRSELETSVLFELICHRYERKSLLVTSNQPFREWDDIFPSGSLPKTSAKRLTVAAVDRLVHHCHIIGIKGESYRQKAAAARVSSDSSVPPAWLTRRDNLVTIQPSSGVQVCSRGKTSPAHRSTWLTPPFNLIETGQPVTRHQGRRGSAGSISGFPAPFMSSGRPEPHTQRRLEPVAAIEEQKLRRRIRKNIRCYVRLGPRLLYRRLWLEGQSVKPQVGATDLAGEGSPAAPSALAQALPPSRWFKGAIKGQLSHYVWAIDFQFDKRMDGRRLKFLNVLHENWRVCLANPVGRRCKAVDVIDTIQELLKLYPLPTHLRMANGPQISHTLQECCTSSCSGAAYIEPGSLWENPFSASFYGRSRDEFLNFELEGSQAVGIAALYPVQHPQTAFSAPSGYALGDSPAGESGLTTHQL